MKTILLTILVMTLSACMISSREPISAQNKLDFEWQELNLDERIKVFSVASPLKIIGTGTISVNPDGSYEADTSAKLRDILYSLNEGMQTAAGVVKEAGGIF